MGRCDTGTCIFDHLVQILDSSHFLRLERRIVHVLEGFAQLACRTSEAIDVIEAAISGVWFRDRLHSVSCQVFENRECPGVVTSAEEGKRLGFSIDRIAVRCVIKEILDYDAREAVDGFDGRAQTRVVAKSDVGVIAFAFAQLYFGPVIVPGGGVKYLVRSVSKDVS